MAWNEKYVTHDAAGGGDGSSGTPWTLAEAITSAAAGDRINVKAGTYANTSTTRTFATAGTTTAPVWWRGYNTAIGDIDTDQTLTKPAITFTTGRFTVTGAHQWFSNLDISGANTGQQVSTATGQFIRLLRCRIENTNATSGASAIIMATPTQLVNCWCKATSSATLVAATSGSGSGFLIAGCVFTGGGIGFQISAATVVLRGCLFLSCGGDGLYVTGTAGNVGSYINGCTFVLCGGDGLEFATVHNHGHHVTDCLFSDCGGYGINNSTGANTNQVFRANNAFYSNASGDETGFGDSPNLFSVTESVDPIQTTATGELKTDALSVGKGIPYPGKFENINLTNYLDIGAHQIVAAPGTGAGAWSHRSIGGGF
jgi:hypothetical protein